MLIRGFVIHHFESELLPSILLQSLLSLPTPEYHHHPLICDPEGKRLAKRDDAETLRSLRSRGISGRELRQRLEFG